VGYNFIEHLVINSFIAGQKLIIRLIAFPLFLSFNNSQSLKLIARFTDIAGYLIGIWTLFELFKQFDFLNRVLRIGFSLIISIIVIFSMLTIAGVFLLR